MKYPVLVCSIVLAAVTSRADVVSDWNNAALTSIRSARTSPPQASRNLAMLHTAIYDAVNGIKAPHETSHQPYRLHRNGPPMGDQEAAASAAARRILVQLWPADQARFDALHNTIL